MLVNAKIFAVKAKTSFYSYDPLMSSALNFGKYRSIKARRRMVTLYSTCRWCTWCTCTWWTCTCTCTHMRTRTQYMHSVHVHVHNVQYGWIHTARVCWSSEEGENYVTKPLRLVVLTKAKLQCTIHAHNARIRALCAWLCAGVWITN